MKIRLNDLPAEGISLVGKFERDIFELDPKDSVQPAGNVRYDIHVEVDKNDVILSGALEAPMKLRCVRCLEEFPYTLKLDEYLSNFDLEEDLENASVIELDQLLREDLLLALPNYPHCDEADDPDHVCPQPETQHFETPAPSNGGDGEKNAAPPTQWSALDKLSDSDR